MNVLNLFGCKVSISWHVLEGPLQEYSAYASLAIYKVTWHQETNSTFSKGMAQARRPQAWQMCHTVCVHFSSNCAVSSVPHPQYRGKSKEPKVLFRIYGTFTEIQGIEEPPLSEDICEKDSCRNNIFPGHISQSSLEGRLCFTSLDILASQVKRDPMGSWSYIKCNVNVTAITLISFTRIFNFIFFSDKSLTMIKPTDTENQSPYQWECSW